MSSKYQPSQGDWTCTEPQCQNVNFARRDKCNKCGKPQDLSSASAKKQSHEIGEAFAEKSKGLFSAEDWQCSKCGNINWARRSTCNTCNAKKVQVEESRTGYGGGFNERGNVTYKEKEDDSDGEFDEFGRKKKKFRGKIPLTLSINVSENKVNKGDYEDDDDEEDDDDDDDVDLSKYALSSDDDSAAPVKATESKEDGSDNKLSSASNNLSSASNKLSSASRRRSSSSSSSSSSRSSSSRRSRSRSRGSRSRSRSHKYSRASKSRTRSRSPRRSSNDPRKDRR